MIPKQVLYLLPVLNFFSQFEGIGGHVSHTLGMVCGLRDAGIKPTVVCGERPEVLEACGIKVIEVPPSGRLPGNRLFWSLEFCWRAFKLIRKDKPNFVYCRYSTLFSPLIRLIRRGCSGIPLVLEVNSFGGQRYRWLSILELFGIKSADLIVCISETLRNEIGQRLSPKLKEKTIIVPNGVDIGRFKCGVKKEKGNSDRIRKKSIVYTGILKPRYGLRTLIAAFKTVGNTYPEATLHFYGDGPYRAVIQDASRDNGSIYFHGVRPLSEIPQLLMDADVLIYPTSREYMFQSPIKLFEYMASGRPIVAARTPQTQEMIGSDCGLLYEIDDPEDLASKVGQLLSKPQLGLNLGQNARKETETKHTWLIRANSIIKALNLESLET